MTETPKKRHRRTGEDRLADLERQCRGRLSRKSLNGTGR